MSAEETIRDQFAKCHDELVARGEELGWRSLGADVRYVALLEREVELARATNDVALYELCFDDVGELTADAQMSTTATSSTYSPTATTRLRMRQKTSSRKVRSRRAVAAE